MAKILLIEDEPALRLSLVDRLRAEGYEIEVAEDGESGFAAARDGAFDLLLLDWMLPGKSGVDVCRDLRAVGVTVPILMLTARSQVVDRVVGLKLGADDYLVKPFDSAELLARIEALLRRPGLAAPTSAERAEFGGVRIDFRGAEVTKDGEPVKVSALELKLLRYFVEHRGEVLSRERLLDEVWGYDATPFTRTVDQHVASLRHKLEPQPSHPVHIRTVHGLGYRFDG